jgi:tetratricopeptide (TPR) repeat protein
VAPKPRPGRHARRPETPPAATPRARRPAGRPGAPALPLLLALGIAALTFAAYAGALDHRFVDWDDQQYVQENPLVLGHRYGALFSAVVSNHWHPLTMWSLALNASTPLSPRPFIATNVVLHVLNTLLVFWLVHRLSKQRVWVAALTALLFGIHPMRVESVAWIAERKDVLYACFFLGAAVAYHAYLQRRAAWLLGVTFALFVLACLAKSSAIAFPGVMVVLDYWQRRKLLEPRAILEKLPFVAVSAVLALMVVDLAAGRDFHGLLHVVGERTAGLSTPPDLTPLQRLTVPMYAHMMYLWRLIAPVDLVAFYPFPNAVEVRTAPFQVAPLVFLASLAAIAWDARRTRVIAFGLGWYFVTIVLVLRWVPVGQVIMGDRYAYLPYIGLFFMLAMGVQAAAQRRPSMRALWWGVPLALAAWWFSITLRQVEVWRDSETLWSRVMRFQPRVPEAYLFRGKHRVQTGRVAEAGADFQRAYDLGLRTGEVYGGLGVAYGATGQLDSSLAMLDRAATLMPERANIYFNRGVTYMRLGRNESALADFERAHALGEPDSARLFTATGFARLQLGDPHAALAAFDRAVASGASDLMTLLGRGSSRMMVGDTAGAVADLEGVLRLDPGNQAALERLQALRR